MESYTEEQLSNNIQEAQIDSVKEILSSSDGVSSIIQTVENASWFAAQMRDKYISPKSQKISCKVKCAHCCSQAVSVSAPEIFRIVNYIYTLEQKIFDKFKKNITTIYKLTKNKTVEERAQQNLPCPFLIKNKCKIYSVRPLRCQKQTSFDVKQCIAAKPQGFPFGSIVEEKAQKISFEAVIKALEIGYKETFPDIHYDYYELTSSVYICLSTEDDLSLRWMHGEDTFKKCKLKFSA